MNKSIREYLDTLFVDPLGSVDLHIVIAGARQWQQQQGYVPLTAGAIEIELADLIDTRRENGRTIKFVRGYSLTDSAGKRKAAADKAAADAAKRAESRAAEAEAQRIEGARNDAKAAEEAEFAARWALDASQPHFLLRDYVEYSPGENITIDEIGDKIAAIAVNTPIYPHEAAQSFTPASREKTERSIRLFPGHEYLGDGVLKDHRWCPEMLLPDGSLRLYWDRDESGERMPIRAGNKQFAFDDPQAQVDPVTRGMAARRRSWLDRPRAPAGRRPLK